MRRIAVVSVARSDYGIYRPILAKIRADQELELALVVGGMHLSPEFGYTIREIESDGFEIAAKVEMLLSSDSPQGMAKSISLGVSGFATARFEMFSAAVAALPFRIPIAHVHGGEITEGALDDAMRHGITKLSHLHFTSTEEYGRRVVQMGEEPWRVSVSGAPAIDSLSVTRWMTKKELEERLGFSLQTPLVLVTYHPVTLEHENTSYQITELLAALQETGFNLLFTAPNADTQGRSILQTIRGFVTGNERARFVENLGQETYFSLMSLAAAMVGNSSSGIIEAASCGLPVVNIGNRQRGRVHGRNVLNVGYTREEIIQGILRATDPAFKETLKDLVNPYGDGKAADQIVAKLKSSALGQLLLVKRFHNLQ
jgi:UDP-hydrolysing UDP-N-acetyl-D-glucosamine 2-epimerase